jgi:membrane-associated protease RseP (regulator of RpoE activity)
VNNLPTDGRPIYVRLWSFVGGTWFNPPLDIVYNALAANVQPPIIAPGSGSYKKKVTVNMATGTPGATIYYSLDGSIPTVGSATTFKFVKPFTLTKTTTVRAKAVKTGIPDSPVASAGFTLHKK